MSNELNFIHRFEPGNRLEAPPLLLLHGTGGDENDLLPLGKAISPGSALLSPRGKVLEHGMPRFFRRLAEGVFDENDVRSRADELADFVEAARARYGIAAPVRWVIRTAQISRQQCCCSVRMYLQAQSCCVRWCRCRSRRRPI